MGVASVMICMYFAITCASDYTGAVLNPTIGIANLTFVAIVKDTSDYMKFLPAYIFGPLFGGATAALVTIYASRRVLETMPKV